MYVSKCSLLAHAEQVVSQFGRTRLVLRFEQYLTEGKLLRNAKEWQSPLDDYLSIFGSQSYCFEWFVVCSYIFEASI